MPRPRKKLSERKLNKDNNTGISGVQKILVVPTYRNKIIYRMSFPGQKVKIFKDFFEACCARKSLEHHKGK